MGLWIAIPNSARFPRSGFRVNHFRIKVLRCPLRAHTLRRETPIHGSILSEPVSVGGADTGGYPGYIHSWYADDFITAGAFSHLKPAIVCVEALGTTYGLFIEPYQSQFVQAPGVSMEEARASTVPLECSHREGVYRLGWFVGSDEAK